MSQSPVSTWSGLNSGSDNSQTDFFRIFEQDEEANGISGTSFPQNTLIYLRGQHDPKIKIVRVVPSSGSFQGAAKTVKRSITETFTFTAESSTAELKYIPDPNSLDGLWFLSPPGKSWDGGGTPKKEIDGRSIIVDIAGFSNRPCPCRVEYTATFKQYAWMPDKTDLQGQDDVWPVHFSILYEVVGQ